MIHLINLPFKNIAELQHELRTPMTGALGALELLKDKTLSQIEQDELIQIACQATEQLWVALNYILNSPVKEIEIYKLTL